jgi:hypothetical protein
MEPDCLNLPSPTCFHGLLTATSKRHELLVAATSRPQPLVAWLLPIGPDSNMYVVNLMMIFYRVVGPYVEARSADLVPSSK